MSTSDALHTFLSQHPFFAGMDPSALQEVERAMRSRQVVRGEQIILEGEPADTAYFIAHGQVRIYRLSPAGREQALADLFPGQSFNLVPAVDGRPAPSSAAARTDGTLYLLGRADFNRLMSRYPSIARVVLTDFAGRLRQLTGLVEELALYSVAERLARLLLRMTEAGAPERFTQQEIANRLGTVREVISRTLRDFQDAGLIRLERQRIVIVDRERLAGLSCPK